MIKKLSLCLLSLFLGVTACASGKTLEKLNNRTKLEDELNQDKWTKLKNKYDWEISFPPCWVADVAGSFTQPKDSGSLFISPGSSCPVEFDRNLVVEITTGDVKGRESPEKYISWRTQYHKENKTEFFLEKMYLKPKDVQAIKTFSTTYGHPEMIKTLLWDIRTNCNDRVLSYMLIAPITSSDKDLSLEKQKMPEVLEKITATFVCTKP